MNNQLQDLIAEAHQLIQNLTGQAEADEAAFALAYRFGFMAGRDVGYTQAINEMHRAWAALATDIRAMAGIPLAEQLDARRTEPGGPAWESHMARHRGEEYQGGPVDYDTGQPLPPAPEPDLDDPWATAGGAAA